MRHVVVVGGGLAGVNAVSSLRELGYRERITVLAEELHPPYDRPPLSKDVLTGLVDHTSFTVDWSGIGADLRLGCAATGLGEGSVHSTQGEIGYDALIVASGCRPVELPGADDVPNVHVLRTIDDALRLRGELRRNIDVVVVVGAGWIGAEVASSAASLGCRVTVVEAAEVLLPQAIGGTVSRHMTAWYAAAGVELLLGRRVAGLALGEVRLDDGQVLAADIVVVGIGVAPATGWLAGSGVRRDERGAIVVDEQLRTSTTGVYAVGDGITYPSRRYETRMRVEHWTHAEQSGHAVAATLLGGETPYDPVPYFWSKQFGRMVQYAGHHRPEDTVVLRGDPSAPRWGACWVRDRTLTAVLAVNKPRDIAAAHRALAAPTLVDPGRLADPSIAIGD